MIGAGGLWFGEVALDDVSKAGITEAEDRKTFAVLPKKDAAGVDEVVGAAHSEKTLGAEGASDAVGLVA